MAAEIAYFNNELGRVHVGRSIIRQAIEPELWVPGKFKPAFTAKNSIDIAFSEEEKRIDISVKVAVAYKLSIQNEAPKIQERIRRSVEAITGLKVGDVTINIEHIFTPGEEKPVEKPKESKEGKS
jgi:uncharacterized alkaline shock family protein YloU